MRAVAAPEKRLVVHHPDGQGRIRGASPLPVGRGEDVDVWCARVRDEQDAVAVREAEAVRVPRAAEHADGIRVPGAREVVDEHGVCVVAAHGEPPTVGARREPVGQVESRVGDDNAPRELTVGEAVAGHGVAPVVADQKLVVAPAERARRDRSGRGDAGEHVERLDVSTRGREDGDVARAVRDGERLVVEEVDAVRLVERGGRQLREGGQGDAGSRSDLDLGQADASARVAGERESPPARGEAHVLRAPHRGERVANVARRFEAGLHARERRRHGPQSRRATGEAAVSEAAAGRAGAAGP